jgi:hypothetical protein
VRSRTGIAGQFGTGIAWLSGTGIAGLSGRGVAGLPDAGAFTMGLVIEAWGLTGRAQRRLKRQQRSLPVLSRPTRRPVIALIPHPRHPPGRGYLMVNPQTTTHCNSRIRPMWPFSSKIARDNGAP